MLKTLENSERNHYIKESQYDYNHVSQNENHGDPNKGDKVGTTTFYSFSKEQAENFEEQTGVKDSNLGTVIHEMRHQYDYDIGNMKDNQYPNTASDPAEIRAVNSENRGRKIENLKMRTLYGGVKINPKLLNNPPNDK